jgi:hypothetical protein
MKLISFPGDNEDCNNLILPVHFMGNRVRVNSQAIKMCRKIAVEYNGQQQYEAVDFFGGIEGLKKQQELDGRKTDLCVKNSVRLFIVRYDEDMDEALSRILNSL